MDKLPTLHLPALPNQLPTIPPHYIKPLAALGSLWASYQLYKLASFTWLHFLRPSGLSKYAKPSADGAAPWALVTGASDGIGKGFVHELARAGVNVVLHGRDERKLTAVKDSMQAQFPAREFRLLVLDAIHDIDNPDRIASAVTTALSSIPLKILINNIGGNANIGPLMQNLQDSHPAHINAWLDVSARFPTLVTRAVLPHLIQHQPSLIVNIGSGVSEMACPWLTVYSGSKAYNKAFSRSLHVELAGQGHEVESIGILVAEVATERSGRQPSLTRPGPRAMAKASLDVVGSGYREVWAHWGHHALFGFLGLLPTAVGERVVLGIAEVMRKEEQEGKRRNGSLVAEEK